MKKLAQAAFQDWEVLSDYLSGQMPDLQKRALEQRLSADPQLAQELESLRKLKTVLRNAPRRRVPHHFTLTREMAASAANSGIRWFPFLRFASALSIVLLAIVFLAGRMMLFNSAQMLPQQAAMVVVTSAVEKLDIASRPSSTPEVIYWGGPPPPAPTLCSLCGEAGDVFAEGQGGAQGPGVGNQKPAAEAVMAPQARESENPEGAVSPKDEAPSMKPAAPQVQVGAAQQPETNAEMLQPAPMHSSTQTEQFSAAPPMVVLPTAEEAALTPGVQASAVQKDEQQSASDGVEKQPLTGSGPILGIRPTQAGYQSVANQLPETQPSHVFASTIWVVVQGIMAFLAVFFALAAYIVWRRSRI